MKDWLFHYKQAEELLDSANSGYATNADQLIRRALVHATLASVRAHEDGYL